MSGRRSGNNISGPQSALTNFLASHNISAAQIRSDFQERQRRASQRDSNAASATATTSATATGTPASATPAASEPGDESEGEDEDEVVVRAAGRKRKAVAQLSENEMKKLKAEEKRKLKKTKKPADSDDDSDLSDAGDVLMQYKKTRKPPGQLENCEICSKRFTVTPYSKEGPNGGLLCTPCGKEFAKDQKALDKGAKKPVVRKKRKMESDKMDGFISRGAKSLQQIAIEKVVANHEAVEELGDLPQSIVERLSAIFSKRRVLKPHTLPLFLRPDLSDVVLHDAAYLEVDDYKQIFAVVPHVRKLVLGNTCQFKDEVVDYMVEKCKNLEEMSLYAPNLVTNSRWTALFAGLGARLTTVKLKWLDASFEDDSVNDILQHCHKLERLKLEYCRRLTEQSIELLTRRAPPTLQHLSLRLSEDFGGDALCAMVKTLGPQLRTLSFRRCINGDDELLGRVHRFCRSLTKLRFTENDTATDRGFDQLFTDWPNPPLAFIDVNCTRDIDNNNPEGPEAATGIAGAGFTAMMKHSGSMLRHLDISSCRHIDHKAFLDAFNGEKLYPAMEFINLSFCNQVDNTVVAGIFKSCPSLKKLVAFGCFEVGEIVLPRDITLIGVPHAQDAIEQFGAGLDVEEALGRMIDVGA